MWTLIGLAILKRVKKYKELLTVKKTAHRQKVLDALNKAKNDPKTFWGKLKCLCKKRRIKKNIIIYFVCLPNPFPQKAKISLNLSGETEVV